MTQERDPITQTQEEITTQQNGNSPAETPVTRQELDRLQQELRGIQGIMDKTANSVRRDVTESVRSEFQAFLESQRQEAQMQSIPEEYRDIVSPLYKQIAELKQAVSAPSQTSEETSQGTVDEVLNAQLARVGLDQNSPGLDLNAYYSGNDVGFVKSIGKAIEMKEGAETPAPEQPASTNNGVTPPPVEGMPQGNAENADIDALLDLRITNQIDQATFEQRMLAQGQRW